MPLYEFRCTNKKCKKEVYDAFIPVSEIEKGSVCPECGKKGKRIYHPAVFKFDFKAGFDSGAGQYFNTAKERDNYIATHGLRRIKD